jgi:hypothetical protein
MCRLLVICLMGCTGEAAVATTMALLGADGLPYQDGEDVTLVAGAQGGYHVWLGYRMMPPPSPSGELQLERTAERASDGALVLRTQTTLQPDGELLPMFMCPAPVGLPVIDRAIEYRLQFSDGGGVVARGEVTLVPHCPADSIEICQRICSG